MTKAFIKFIFILALASFSGTAFAMKIQEIESPNGIKAWLVEEHSVPLVSIRFAFRGGSTQDAPGKEGTAYLLSAMLDEGAGDLTSQQFQEKLDELAIKINFDTDRDSFTGSFKTLSENADEAFEMLRLALNKPRFDTDAIERMRKQIRTSIKMGEKDPDQMATRAWFSKVFPKHPYGRRVKGTLDSLNTITREDLITFAKNNFARENLIISVVGAIDAKRLAETLDKVFGELPQKASLNKVDLASFPDDPSTTVIEHDVPQSVVQFGGAGVKRSDKDFVPAYVLNYILGGGGFSSRLMEEVREKRGLAYSVYSYLYPLDHSALFLGGVATKNKDVYQSIDIIKKELKKLAEDGPTEEELKDAKLYLTGSYALRFDTSSKIASQQLGIQMENLGVDYIVKRNDLIQAVTMEDIKRVANKMFGDGKLMITIVGKPAKAEKADDKS